MSSSTLKVGIIGLPNVGKSTLFNAIMGKQAALTAPYPFATIEPNVGVVDVPDERLVKLREAMFPEEENNEQKTENNEQNKFSQPPLVFANITFVDIAGLVKGASEGQGLGNKFLSHIRDVDLILHVLRDFEADGIPRHQDSKNPEHDAEIVEMELELKDLEAAERKENKENKRINTNKRMSGNEAIGLSSKPTIYAVNVGEDKIAETINKGPALLGQGRALSDKTVLFFSAKIEEDIAQLSKIEQKEFLRVYGLETSGLDRIITECFHRLGLISFFTAPLSSVAPAGQAGKWEIRAWPLPADSTAVRASGVIHSDFEKLFIRAEVIEWQKLAEAGNWTEAKEKGWVRTEGRDYVMKDGDVCNFLIGR